MSFCVLCNYNSQTSGIKFRISDGGQRRGCLHKVGVVWFSSTEPGYLIKALAFALFKWNPVFLQLLRTPAHVLPSASFLCSMFVNSLLLSTGRRESKGHSLDVFRYSVLRNRMVCDIIDHNILSYCFSFSFNLYLQGIELLSQINKIRCIQ